MQASWVLAVFAGLGVALAMGDARADTRPSLAPLGEAIAKAIANLNFHSQLQVGAAGVLADGRRSGGMELRGSLNMAGVGGSLGGRVEPYPSGKGGLGFVDLELRPLPLAGLNFYRVLDPYVCAGGEIGGGSRGFRAAQTIGLGLDIGLFARADSNKVTRHPAFTLRYQFRTIQTPADLPRHLLHVGGAFRLVF